MKSIVALVSVALVAMSTVYMLTSAPAVDVETQFQEFVSTYRKSYATNDEYTKRLTIFS